MSFWSGLPQPIIGLSPMDGMTDAAFRLMVASHGRPDVTFTEFTSVADVCHGPERLLATLLYSERERPILAQLYGKDPALFYQAAHVVCALGFDGLDINMGCPSRNVASTGAGAGLIRAPDLAHEIMRAARQGIADWAAGQSLTGAGLKPLRDELVQAMNLRRAGCSTVPRRPIPLSVKTRIGYDSVVIEPWVDHLLAEQPSAISIHGRTLTQMYRGDADWDAIRRASERARGTGALVLGNGDLLSMQDVVRRVRESGVQGVLVGRGALGSPWFFSTKESARGAARGRGQAVRQDGSGSKESDGVVILPLSERFLVMQEHAEHFEAIFGRERFPRMRKHLAWYCKGFPGAAAMRDQMVRTCSSSDVRRLVEEYQAGASEQKAGLYRPAGPVAIANG